jgi:hypothetical protein
VNIDSDKLSENDLIDLNNRIVARLRFLNQMRAHSQMLDFGIGDRVTFQPDGRPPLFGIITRYNKNRHSDHRRRPALECRAWALA